ncbi:MBL fold metallo-hydrolase [Candidatus Micrarchaeota archaeon]|nr:MBL fold metallo-hydrolase [Candidatus Micrarchaeota archaeon]
MEIVFLGTGGGRINLIKQARGTGGFRINSPSANIHVDPGPGALIHCLKNRQDPLTLDGIIVTHDHIDHVSDAMALIEGMSHYGLKKKGIIIGSRDTLAGDETGDRGISGYHQSKAAVVHIPEFGQKKTFQTGHGEFALEAIPMKHEEPSAFGFKLAMDGKILGHISDTEYMERLGRDFSGCNLLIVNCIKPEADKYGGHLWTGEVAEILKVARPKLCVMTHMGMKLLKLGPAKEAEKIERESGVKTIAARDGMRLAV